MIQPTCVVPERAHSHAARSPSPKRGAFRSRTYRGLAAAMALAWVPTLAKYVVSNSDAEECTSRNLVEAARDVSKRRYGSELCFEPKRSGSEVRDVPCGRMIGAVRTEPTSASRYWAACEHGAVLVEGPSEGAESPFDDAGRCCRRDCVDQALQWWRQFRPTALAAEEQTGVGTLAAMSSVPSSAPAPPRLKHIRLLRGR